MSMSDRSVGRRLLEHLEADGYQVVIVIGLRLNLETGLVEPKISCPRALPETLGQRPDLAQTLRDAIENVISMGKPPDDRKLTPGARAEFCELE